MRGRPDRHAQPERLHRARDRRPVRRLPGQRKTLGAIQRAFVVTVQNEGPAPHSYRLTIENQPAGGTASFLQFVARRGTLTLIDVSVPAFSSVARSVFATSSNPAATIRVDVAEIAAPGAGTVLAGGLTGSVVLNSDASNPSIQNPSIQNPSIQNPDIQVAEVYNPNITSAFVANPSIQNPSIQNVVLNPSIQNPSIQNPSIQNPSLQNDAIANLCIVNPLDPEPVDSESVDPESVPAESVDPERGRRQRRDRGHDLGASRTTATPPRRMPSTWC